MERKTHGFPANSETTRTVSVFLNYPKSDGKGRIQGVYPSKFFSRLISQIDKLETGEQGLAKLIGTIGAIEAVLTHIENAELGTDVKLGGRGDPCLGERKIRRDGNASGELAQFETRLVRFRNDRNCLFHQYLWKDGDDESWEAMLDRNQKFLNDLIDYFFEGQPSNNPGHIAFRFPQLYGLTPNRDMT